MAEQARVIIHSRSRMSQIHSFEGMERHRGIYPSDIDGLIDYNGNARILFEGKVEGNNLPTGQRMMLENSCSGWDKGSGAGTAIALVYEHNSTPDEIVFVAECEVREIYYCGTWYEKYKGERVVDVVGKIEKFWIEKNISI